MGNPAHMRPISITPVLYRLYAWILAQWVIQRASTLMPWLQRAYWPQGSCLDILELLEAAARHAKLLGCLLLIFRADLKKAFDSALYQQILRYLARLGMPFGLSCVLCDLFSHLSACIRTGYGLTRALPILCSIRQGCPLSPVIFALVVAICLAAVNETLPSVNVDGVDLPALLGYAESRWRPS